MSEDKIVEVLGWEGHSVRKEDKGHVSEIRCQHPTCKTRPRLRIIFWVDGIIPIGKSCIKKGCWSMLEDHR